MVLSTLGPKHLLLAKRAAPSLAVFGNNSLQLKLQNNSEIITDHCSFSIDNFAPSLYFPSCSLSFFDGVIVDIFWPLL